MGNFGRKRIFQIGGLVWALFKFEVPSICQSSPRGGFKIIGAGKEGHIPHEKETKPGGYRVQSFRDRDKEYQGVLRGEKQWVL